MTLALTWSHSSTRWASRRESSQCFAALSFAYRYLSTLFASPSPSPLNANARANSGSVSHRRASSLHALAEDLEDEFLVLRQSFAQPSTARCQPRCQRRLQLRGVSRGAQQRQQHLFVGQPGTLFFCVFSLSLTLAARGRGRERRSRAARGRGGVQPGFFVHVQRQELQGSHVVLSEHL